MAKKVTIEDLEKGRLRPQYSVLKYNVELKKELKGFPEGSEWVAMRFTSMRFVPEIIMVYPETVNANNPAFYAALSRDGVMEYFGIEIKDVKDCE